MSESEVIRRLKEHIRACIIKHGRILKTDKGYIVKYIKDFLPWLSKEETESFLGKNYYRLRLKATSLM